MSNAWLQKEIDRPYHPASQIFPLMEGVEFDQFKADIAERRLLKPITLHPNGSVLDGRNRHRACILLEIQPRFETWKDDGQPVAFVISMNLQRRQLTASQRAAIAVDTLPALEAERKKTQGIRTDLMGEDFAAKMQQSSARAAEDAAKVFSVSPRYIYQAKSLQTKAPDLFEQVKEGPKTIASANREYNKRTKVMPPPLEGHYRVFYADPPWEYSDSGVINDDNYGHVERHYPSMSIKELCEMGERIKAVSESDAVLFLWVTSPMLEDCFKIIKAWGFKYKTSFVWDKVRHNFGHYNSVRHELLLICTHGSCTPDIPTLIDSVQTIERSEIHSQKPEEFRKIIDTLYTHGNKIELFARVKVAGWNIWGNECLETPN